MPRGGYPPDDESKAVMLKPIDIDFSDLDNIPVDKIRAKRAEVEALLTHRSPSTRFYAVHALAAAGVGSRAIAARLAHESHAVVLAELCDAAVELECTDTEEELRRLATHHPSSLARTYAYLALAGLFGEKAIPDLWDAARDRSRRVRSTAGALLLSLGEGDAIGLVLQALESRDYVVRCSIGNVMASDPPAAIYRETVKEALKRALAREESVAAREGLQAALKEL